MMIEGITPTNTVSGNLYPSNVGRTVSPAAAEKEFLTVFYKEMLKQAFKSPSLSLAGEENENNFFSTFSSEMMVEQLAEELVKNEAFRPGWVPTTGKVQGND